MFDAGYCQLGETDLDKELPFVVGPHLMITGETLMMQTLGDEQRTPFRRWPPFDDNGGNICSI